MLYPALHFTQLQRLSHLPGLLVCKGIKVKKTQGQKQKRKQICIGKEQIKGGWLNLLHYDLTYWQIFFPHILHLNYTQLLNYQILMELFISFNKTWRESNFYQPSRAWFWAGLSLAPRIFSHLCLALTCASHVSLAPRFFSHLRLVESWGGW